MRCPCCGSESFKKFNFDLEADGTLSLTAVTCAICDGLIAEPNWDKNVWEYK